MPLLALKLKQKYETFYWKINYSFTTTYINIIYQIIKKHNQFKIYQLIKVFSIYCKIEYCFTLDDCVESALKCTN